MSRQAVVLEPEGALADPDASLLDLILEPLLLGGPVREDRQTLSTLEVEPCEHRWARGNVRFTHGGEEVTEYYCRDCWQSDYRSE
jgi:hypothetical protein